MKVAIDGVLLAAMILALYAMNKLAAKLAFGLYSDLKKGARTHILNRGLAKYLGLYLGSVVLTWRAFSLLYWDIAHMAIGASSVKLPATGLVVFTIWIVTLLFGWNFLAKVVEAAPGMKVTAWIREASASITRTL